MRNLTFFLLYFQLNICLSQNLKSQLPVLKKNYKSPVNSDWLVNRNYKPSVVYRNEDASEIIVDNGLIRRSFRISPNLACVDFTNLTTGEQLLRSVGPEARINIDGITYNIGGLYGQKDKAYLTEEWIESLESRSSDFHFKSYAILDLPSYLNWTSSKKYWLSNSEAARGLMVTFNFVSDNPALNGITVDIHYEIYDGIPLLCKWLEIKNTGKHSISINSVLNEVLAVHEEESAVAGSTEKLKTPHGIYVESNYAFNNAMAARLSDQTTHWKADSTYTSQVSYLLNTPCLLEVYPPIGPGIELAQGKTYKSIRTNELLLDGYDRERNGLAQRRMYSKIAPWATENPIFMHLTTVDTIKVRSAIDQCAEVGYEGVILSFFSGLNMEDVSDKNISYYKDLADYAHRKGILLGGYSLFSSRSIDDKEDVIDPQTGKANVHALFGKAPCLASKWGIEYLLKIKKFIVATGFDILEHDGPYAGDVCASTRHPGHKDLKDSQWTQMELQKGFYRWCAERNVYVNAPDWYFLDGTNKVALGYREQNFSLPREQQIILNRQNIYDGTWEKMPSMSWGFVPLTEYHGGGAAATLEPLSKHLYAYELLMMQYYGAGVQACYRGPRLYDSPETKNLVIRVIGWYKKYRRILNSDIIHLRRPDGRDWDGILHVDPIGENKGLAMLYNPLGQVITRTIKFPLYYTGLKGKVTIKEKEGKDVRYKINGDGTVSCTVNIPANGYTWLVMK